MTNIGIIPILWITLGSLFFMGGAAAVWHGANLAWPPTREKPKINTSPVVVQLPSVGNLKQRAIALSDEIMEDLYEHG